MTIGEFLIPLDTTNIDELYINDKRIYNLNDEEASTHFNSVYFAFTLERIDSKYVNERIYIPNGYKINTQLHFKIK